MLKWPTKDPNALLDFYIDWTDWLAEVSDTIDTIDWIVPDGITSETETVTGGRAYIWLSGGTNGQFYNITCRITTAAGRVDDRTVRLQVRSK